MKRFAVMALLGTLLAAETSVRGNISLNTQGYLLRPEGKHAYSLTAGQEIETTYEQGNFTANLRAMAQQDSHDLQADAKKNRRSFARIDEAYLAYEDDAGENRIMAGRSLRFWGALEVRNIVDSFNLRDLRSDVFVEEKVGAFNAALTHYTETGEIALIVKSYEENRAMAAYPYVYYVFPSFVSYDRRLRSKMSRWRPTLFLKVSGTLESDTPLDYALILQNGYDTQRYFTSDGPFDGSPVTLRENAYLANKLMTYDTLVVGSTLFKFEGAVADVRDDPNISDYLHLAVGAEHTIEQVVFGGDLGLIGEYYWYRTFEGDKYDDLELFEVFQNDLFLGVRISMNDAQDTSFVGGLVFDTQYGEQNWYGEFERRIGERYRLSLDYRYIEPSQSQQTAYALLGRHQRIGLKIALYF